MNPVKSLLASIHHPASHKEISPTTLYSEKVNVTAKSKKSTLNTPIEGVFIQKMIQNIS